MLLSKKSVMVLFVEQLDRLLASDLSDDIADRLLLQLSRIIRDWSWNGWSLSAIPVYFVKNSLIPV